MFFYSKTSKRKTEKLANTQLAVSDTLKTFTQLYMFTDVMF